jgi:hypothetical protein
LSWVRRKSATPRVAAAALEGRRPGNIEKNEAGRFMPQPYHSSSRWTTGRN